MALAIALAIALGLLVGGLAGYLLGARAARTDARRLVADAERAARERIEQVLGTREQMATQVKAATADALGDASKQLAALTEQMRKADSEAAQKALGEREAEIRRLSDPLRQGLERIEREVAEFSKERKATDRATKALLAQMDGGVKDLRTQTSSLVKALRRPQTRGQWGEVQLRRCVEIAGMTEHVDFELQHTLRDGEGWLRPDAVILLPAERRVVVDSKVPLDAYLEAIEASEDPARKAELTRHARQAREHIRSLASKRYQDQFAAGETPDFVVCFFPSEPALHAAFEADADLYAYALEEGVLIATPTTLIGLLRTIELGWRQERIAAEVHQIAAAARELHGRFGTFLTALAKVGRGLTTATGAYNQAIGSVEGRLLPQLRKVEDLGASSGKRIEASEPVEQAVRPIAAAELPTEAGEASSQPRLAELPAPPERDADAA